MAFDFSKGQIIQSITTPNIQSQTIQKVGFDFNSGKDLVSEEDIDNGILSDIASGINGLYQKYAEKVKSTRPVKAFGTVIGAGGAAIGGTIGALTETGIQAYKGIAGKGFDIKEIAESAYKTGKETAKFGYDIAREGVPAATLGGAGRVVQLAVGGAMAYDGINSIKQGIKTKDPIMVEQGLFATIPAILGFYGATGKFIGDIKSKVPVAVTTAESPILGATKEVLRAAGGALRGEGGIVFNPQLKAQVLKEYRTLRYGEQPFIINNATLSLFQSAIKPIKKKQPTFKKSLNIVLNDMVDSGKISNDLATFKNTISDKKAEIWSDVEGALVAGQEANLKIDGSAIADAIRDTKNKNIKLQKENVEYNRNPDTGKMERTETGELRALEDRAKKYENTKLDFLEAEQLLEELNAELAPYYSKNPLMRALLKKSNSEVAADLALADSIRKQQDMLLESIEQNGFPGLKQKYGAYREIGDAVINRLLSLDNFDISSFAEKLTAGRQAAQVGLAIASQNPTFIISALLDKFGTAYIKHIDTPNAKIKHGFAEIKKLSEIDKRKSLIEQGKIFLEEHQPIGMTIQDVSKKPEFYKLAEGKQATSPTQKNKVFQSMPDREGYEKVFMPYGEKGKGFYYNPIIK